MLTDGNVAAVQQVALITDTRIGVDVHCDVDIAFFLLEEATPPAPTRGKQGDETTDDEREEQRSTYDEHLHVGSPRLRLVLNKIAHVDRVVVQAQLVRHTARRASLVKQVPGR